MQPESSIFLTVMLNPFKDKYFIDRENVMLPAREKLENLKLSHHLKPILPSRTDAITLSSFVSYSL